LINFKDEMEHLTYSSVTDIPISDIKKFLAQNNIHPNKNETLYECFEKSIFDEKYTNRLTSIKNWKLSYFNNLTKYLESLPNELILKIMENTNYEDLQTFYKTNKKFYDLYHSKSFIQKSKTIKHSYHTSRFLLSKMKEIDFTTKFVVFDRLNIDLIIIMEETFREYTFLENERFIDIMWLTGIRIEYKEYVNDREHLTKFLFSKGKLSDDTLDIKGNIESWSLDKLNYYYNVYHHKQINSSYPKFNYYYYTSKPLGQQILDRMIELNQQ